MSHAATRQVRVGWITVLCAGLMLASCRPVDEAPIAAFGGDLAKVPPYRDVLGFAKVDVDSLQSGIDWVLSTPMADRIPLSPLKEILPPLVQVLSGDSGAGLVVLFLDRNVHGSPFAFAFRGDADAFRKRVVEDSAIENDPTDDAFLVPVTVSLDSLQDLMQTAMKVLNRSSETEIVRYFLVRESHSSTGEFWLFLPALDGRRNLRETLLATGALAVDSPFRHAFNLDFDRVVRRVRPQIEMMVNTLLSMRTVMEARPPARSWRWQRPSVIDFALSLFENLDHLFVGVRSADQWESYWKVVPSSGADELRAAHRDQDLEELANTASAFSLRCSFDLRVLESAWQRLTRESRRFRQQRMQLDIARYFEGTVEMSADLEQGAVRLFLAWKEDGEGPESWRKVVKDSLEQSLNDLAGGLFDLAVDYQAGDSAPDGEFLDRLVLSRPGEQWSCRLRYTRDGFECIVPAAGGEPETHPDFFAPTRADFSVFDLSGIPSRVSSLLVASGEDPSALLIVEWTDDHGICFSVQRGIDR